MAGELSWQSLQETLVLQGELDRETLLPLWQQRETLLADKSRIDVSQLQRVDSSGLALLVHFASYKASAAILWRLSVSVTGWQR